VAKQHKGHVTFRSTQVLR